MYGDDMMTQTKLPGTIAIPKQHYMFLVKPPIWIFRTQNTIQLLTPRALLARAEQTLFYLSCVITSTKKYQPTFQFPFSLVGLFKFENRQPKSLLSSLFSMYYNNNIIIITFVYSLFILSNNKPIFKCSIPI